MSEVIDDFEFKNKRLPQQKIVSLVVWGLLLAIAVLFQVMKVPGGSFLLITISGAFTGYNISQFVLLRGRILLNSIIMVASLMWFIYLLAAMNSEWPFSYNINGIIVFITLALCTFAIHQWNKKYKAIMKSSSNNKSL